MADFTRSIELYPDHPGPWHLRGKLLVDRLGRYEEGIADLDRLLAMREVAEGYQLRAGAERHVAATCAGAPELADYFRTVPALEPYRSRPWFTALLG